MDELLDTPQTVELIASGYEWICPKCDNYQKEIEAKGQVTCTECQSTWETGEIHHAHA